VIPALVTGLITERGVLAATRDRLAKSFSERVEAAKHPTRSPAE
jgi:hypothetical protein